MLTKMNLCYQGYQQIQAFAKTTAKKCSTMTHKNVVKRKLQRLLRFKFSRRLLFNVQWNLGWKVVRFRTLFTLWRRFGRVRGVKVIVV